MLVFHWSLDQRGAWPKARDVYHHGFHDITLNFYDITLIFQDITLMEIQGDISEINSISSRVIHIQNQTRMSYEAVYRCERPAQYQPECRARRAARRLILGWPRASIYGRVRHPRLVVYLLYLRALISIYLQ